MLKKDVCNDLAGETQEKRKCIWNKNGHILEMIFDLNEQTLTLRVNNADFIAAYSNIATPKEGYRLAMITHPTSQFYYSQKIRQKMKGECQQNG